MQPICQPIVGEAEIRLGIREARPDDAEAIVRILNPIIAAGVYTAFDTPFTSEGGARIHPELPDSKVSSSWRSIKRTTAWSASRAWSRSPVTHVRSITWVCSEPTSISTAGVKYCQATIPGHVCLRCAEPPHGAGDHRGHRSMTVASIRHKRVLEWLESL